MKCKRKHSGPPRFVWTAMDTPRGMYHEECQSCGAWLPLGPARDDGPHAEAVAIEIEAARLAAHIQHDDFPEDEPEDEWADYGWASHASGCDVYDGTWHGHLARAICEHDEGGE